ncbi:MAG: hypothetical protein EZS28_034413, partial [Streblomastix strix]
LSWLFLSQKRQTVLVVLEWRVHILISSTVAPFQSALVIATALIENRSKSFNFCNPELSNSSYLDEYYFARDTIGLTYANTNALVLFLNSILRYPNIPLRKSVNAESINRSSEDPCPLNASRAEDSASIPFIINPPPGMMPLNYFAAGNTQGFTALSLTHDKPLPTLDTNDLILLNIPTAMF